MRKPLLAVLSVSSVLVLEPAAYAPPGQLIRLHDNGLPDGVNGYSNATRDVFGSRRTILDDFEIVSVPWIVNGIRHRGIWVSIPPVGSGTGMEIVFRVDDNGSPGPIFATTQSIAYSEELTGNIMFSREEYSAWTSFEDVWLPIGRYWIEAATIGPENNFWLTAPVLGNECWVNYEDLGGLQSGTDQFGVPSDLNWELYGDHCGKGSLCCLPDGTCEYIETCPLCFDLGGTPVAHCETGCPGRCLGDVNGSGVVDFQDVVALLTDWGPCRAGCAADFDNDGWVGFSDLLILLANWGSCA